MIYAAGNSFAGNEKLLERSEIRINLFKRGAFSQPILDVRIEC